MKPTSGQIIVSGLKPFIHPGAVHELRILDCVDNPKYPPFIMFGYFDSGHMGELAEARRSVDAASCGCLRHAEPGES